jgi:drug/metabolite transporter (DMT)-like permease
MLKNRNLQNLLELNIAIIFISTSGALGKHIDLPVPVIICSRSILAGLLIFLFCRWKGYGLKIQKKDSLTFLLSGLLMGLHWITYFYSLKLSNVAIGMISLYTYPVITSFLEPLILKTKFQSVNLLLGLFVMAGIYLLVPELTFESNYTIAIGLGILSGVFYALRNIISKSKIQEYNGSVLMLYQLIVIATITFPFYFVWDVSSFSKSIPELLFLSIMTTAIGHTWFLHSFKKFSVTSASIISSLQPVYGILIGMLFLSEFPESTTIFGGLLIILTAMIENALSFRKASKTSTQ